MKIKALNFLNRTTFTSNLRKCATHIKTFNSNWIIFECILLLRALRAVNKSMIVFSSNELYKIKWFIDKIIDKINENMLLRRLLVILTFLH